MHVNIFCNHSEHSEHFQKPIDNSETHKDGHKFQTILDLSLGVFPFISSKIPSKGSGQTHQRIQAETSSAPLPF